MLYILYLHFLQSFRSSRLSKQNKNNKIWWIDDLDSIDKHMFSFDKIKIFNLFADYPYNLTPEEKEIFDKENPYWKDFFKERIK